MLFTRTPLAEAWPARIGLLRCINAEPCGTAAALGVFALAARIGRYTDRSLRGPVRAATHGAADEFPDCGLRRESPGLRCNRGEALVLAQAGGFPTLEFAQGCRNMAAGNTTILDHCMNAEQRARQKLTTEWDKFPHADRTECTALARLGTVLQSYVELITCLEMEKDARALPKSAKE